MFICPWLHNLLQRLCLLYVKTVWQRKVQVLSDQFLGTDVYMNIKMKENGYYYNSKNIKIT